MRGHDFVLPPVESGERDFVRGERIEKIIQGTFDCGGPVARFDVCAPDDFAEQYCQHTVRGEWDGCAHLIAGR